MLSLPAVATMGDKELTKKLTEDLWTQCKEFNADENIQETLSLINCGANVNAKHEVCHLFLL